MIRSSFILLIAAASLRADESSYRQEVVAVMARTGCNAGACHGNLNGKGGFKLSLRGEDPVYDHQRLTRDFSGRRVDVTNPDQSLMLLKATGQVPHEGGIRFSLESREYAILRSWIANGCKDDANAEKPVALEVGENRRVIMAPADRTRVIVKAKYPNGKTVDVTHLAAFDLSAVSVAAMNGDGALVKEDDGDVVVAVRYLHLQTPVSVSFIPKREVPKLESLAGSKHPIDLHLANHLKELRLEASPVCTDEVFIRRVYLDACGVPPTADAVRKFLADTAVNKREKLIDSVLARQEFNEYWAMKWSDLLRNEEKSLDRKGVQIYHRWIKDWIAADKPLNEFAREIVAARGSTYENPPANFYRALRDPYSRAESVAQVFLGTRIGCARCHNHPFDRWTQDDYHQFAAFFPRVQYRVLSNDRKDTLDKHEFVGNQVVYEARDGEVTLPRTNGKAAPKTLGDDRIINDDDRTRALAEWVADAKNPFFAKAQANRIWYHLMGRGLVEPNDDFRAANPPSHPDLLEHLAKEFINGGNRLKPLVKHILMSRAYQLSSSPNEVNKEDEVHLSRALVLPLEAEQLLDAMSRTLGVSPQFNGYPKGTRAIAMPAMLQGGRRRTDSSMSDRFLRVFGKPERVTTCECERHDDAGILQAFQMINGEQINQMLRETNNKIGKLMEDETTDEARLNELYLTALARYPHSQEKEKLLMKLKGAKEKRSAWEDIAWGLLNSKEFLLRR